MFCVLVWSLCCCVFLCSSVVNCVVCVVISVLILMGVLILWLVMFSVMSFVLGLVLVCYFWNDIGICLRVVMVFRCRGIFVVVVLFVILVVLLMVLVLLFVMSVVVSVVLGSCLLNVWGLMCVSGDSVILWMLVFFLVRVVMVFIVV